MCHNTPCVLIYLSLSHSLAPFWLFFNHFYCRSYIAKLKEELEKKEEELEKARKEKEEAQKILKKYERVGK